MKNVQTCSYNVCVLFIYVGNDDALIYRADVFLLTISA